MAKMILHYKSKTSEFPIDGVLTIGRQTDNTIRLKEGKASRHHARVTKSGDSFLIEDLGSSNGTRVNGRKIKRCSLRHGDTIQIGNARIQFEDAAQKQAARPAKKKDKDDPLIGTVLGGYKIESKLGHGGMGTVYKAIQLSMDRTVALKVLRKDLNKDKKFVKGFLQEARTAGQLTHPALVQVHDVGEADGTLYFSMEMVEGETVNDLLKKKGKLPILQSIDLAFGVSEALECAARHKIVHQDVKPHNIMLDKRGNVKLADLGLATMTGRPKKGDKHGPIMGTPHYMPPEQSQREEIDARTDLYALGATLFQMVTGRVPFDGPNSLVILTKHITEDRPDPRDYNVTVPDELAELIMRMMAVDKGDRPASPTDVLGQLKLIKKNYKLQEASKVEQQKGSSGVIKRRAVLSKPSVNGPAPIAPPKPAPPGKSASRREKIPTMDSRASTRARGVQRYQSLINFGILVVVLFIGFYFLSGLLPKDQPVSRRPKGKPAVKPDPKPNPAPVDTKKTHDPKPVPKTPKKVETKEPPEEEVDEAALAELRKVLDARDRAIQSGNFVGARKALEDYTNKYNAGAAGTRGREELTETKKMIGEALDQMIDDAKKAAEKGRYRQSAFYCTRVISADPNGSNAANARAIMNHIDNNTQARYKRAIADEEKALKISRLDNAIKALSMGLDALGGTKWAEPLNARQFRLVLANKFLNDCEAARKAAEAKGKKIQIMAINLLNRQKVPSTLESIRGLIANVTMKNMTIPYKLETMKTNEIYELVEKLGCQNNHLGFANLLFVLKRDEQAKQELQRALQTPEQAEEAARLSAGVSRAEDMHIYDFSKWQHQSDWEASLGAWATKNDRYVLESPEGGDTRLKPDAIGGPFSARNASVAFEFDTNKLNEGYYIAGEFGTEQRNITVLFNGDGFTLMVNADESAQKKGKWKPGAAPTKVELRIKNDNVVLLLNGKKAGNVKAKGTVYLKGSLALRVREATCAFDNIVLRRMK